MPGRKSKYSTLMNGQIKTELFAVLAEATDYDNPTIDWIKARSIFLSGITQQKLSRSLNEMLEMGILGKGKMKNGRMVYRLKTEYSDDVPNYFPKSYKENEDEEEEDDEDETVG